MIPDMPTLYLTGVPNKLSSEHGAVNGGQINWGTFFTGVCRKERLIQRWWRVAIRLSVNPTVQKLAAWSCCATGGALTCSSVTGVNGAKHLKNDDIQKKIFHLSFHGAKESTWVVLIGRSINKQDQKTQTLGDLTERHSSQTSSKTPPRNRKCTEGALAVTLEVLWNLSCQSLGSRVCVCVCEYSNADRCKQRCLWSVTLALSAGAAWLLALLPTWTWCCFQSRLFSDVAQERHREGAAVSGEIGLPLPIIVNIMRADRRAGCWDAGRGRAAWESAAKTHPLRPKLHLIYMFTLLNLSQDAGREKSSFLLILGEKISSFSAKSRSLLCCGK